LKGGFVDAVSFFIGNNLAMKQHITNGVKSGDDSFADFISIVNEINTANLDLISTVSRNGQTNPDPNTVALRSEPRDMRDLMIAADNGWCIAFDNLSPVPTWLSDALCRLATGGGFATRELYANDEDVLFDAMRPVLITSIEELATRGDLLHRALIIYLPTTADDQRRTEAAVWSEFEAVQASIFGVLLNGISAALRNLSRVKLPRLLRMRILQSGQWRRKRHPALSLALLSKPMMTTGSRLTRWRLRHPL
jgi:hypothetical protein